MTLQGLLQVIARRWRILVATPLLTLAAALVTSFLLTPQYESRTTLFVSATPTTVGASDLLQGNSFTQARVRSYVDVVTTDAVLAPVIDGLGLDVSVDEFAEQVSAASPLDTVLIEVTVTDTSPEQAAALADAVGQSLVAAVTELERPTTDGASPIRVSVVQPAAVPESPVSPQPFLNAALGLLAGLGLAVGLAIARDTLDTRVSTAQEAADILDAPILASLQIDPAMADDWLVSDEQGFSVRAEAFRRLRTNLQFLDVKSHRRSFVITSALAGEGKTTVAVNLALAVAASGSRVVLVDADLRRPQVADYLQIEGSVGLTTVLIGRADVADVVQRWGGDGHLDVIASGAVPPNPSELLGSASMEKLITSLEADYDIVLIDSPPMLPVTDPTILSAVTAGAIVVASVGMVRTPQLATVRESMAAAGGALLGVVVNRVTESRGAYGAYGYAHYGAETTKGSRSVRRGRRTP